MKTKREKYIAKINDGKLIRYFHAHSDRGMDRLLSGLSNIEIGMREDNMDNIASARDYLIKALEDISAQRFAGKEIYHRYRRLRGVDKHKTTFIKEVLKRDVPEPDEVEMPPDFFAV